jgi:serine protease Do
MKKKEDIVVESKPRTIKYGYLRTLGVSLVILTSLLVVSITILLSLRHSPELQSVLLGRPTVNEQSQITITESENVIINVVKESVDSVVSIAVARTELRRGLGAVDVVSNIGTGFIVDENGIIVTNQHVVSDENASYIVVTLDEREYDVVEVVRDTNSDIAILKIDASNLPFLELGNSDEIIVGQTAIAIGTPLGRFAGSVTTGVVSGVNRTVTTSSGWFGETPREYEDVIQTDAAVNPGNSGGPLISTEGKVIGVNFATSAGAENISFAIPANIVKQRLDEYRTYGRFIRSYFGITYQMISSYEVMLYGDGVVEGALVVGTDPTGPAAKAGIARGDIITKINSNGVSKSFASIIQSYKVGDEISVELWNEGEIRTAKVKLVEAN